MKWARIFVSLPRPLSSTALPTFFDEFRYRYHATPQWNMSRAGRVFERGKFLNEDLRRNINQDVVEKGGDLVTGYFPRSSSKIELKNRTTSIAV